MAGNKRRRFGRIRRRESGRYTAGYVGPDNRLHWCEKSFDTKDAANAWLSAREREIELNIWSPELSEKAATRAKGRLTFRAFAEKWLEGRPLKPRTRAHYANILKTRIYPTFGDMPLVAISADAIDGWYGTVSIGKPTMQAHAYGLMRTILSSAVQARVIDFNPCHIRGAGRAKQAHKSEPASLAELEVIVKAMPDRYKTMVLMAAWCAMRFGELAELRRKDIDLKESKGVKSGRVKIRRAVVRVDGQAVIGTPKSDAGTRDVAIPPHLIPMIEKHLKTHTEPGKESLLFPAASGGHMAPSTLYKVFYPARKAAGREDLRFHDLRHTGAVLAAQTGASLAELMGRLGHSTQGAAMRYQHAAKNRDAEIATALSALITREGE